MIRLHHLENSRSQRILWALHELDVPYEVEHYKRDRESRAPASLRAVHALGKSPVIENTEDLVDGKPRVIAETGAILEYLLDVFDTDGKFRPEAGSEAFYDYRYFLHFAEGSLMPPLVVKLIMSKLSEAKVPFFIRPVLRTIAGKVDGSYTDGELKANFDFVESQLEGREFIAGELSGADFAMIFPLEAALSRAGDQMKHPNIAAYVARIHARPTYQRALEVGGPYDYA